MTTNREAEGADRGLTDDAWQAIADRFDIIIPGRVIEAIAKAFAARTTPASAAQAVQQPEPAGWKLVPIEPTEAMMAAIPFPTSVTPRLGAECWRAMLAAAPQPDQGAAT